MSALKCLQTYAADYPVQGWLLSVGMIAVLSGTLFVAFPDARNIGTLFLTVSFALGSPTLHLLRRFSKEEQAKNPVAPQQEQIVGVFGFSAALFAITAWVSSFLVKRLGFSAEVSVALITAHAFLLLFALVFGVAAQNTKAGRLGFWIAAGWFGLLLCFTCFVLLRRSLHT